MNRGGHTAGLRRLVTVTTAIAVSLLGTAAISSSAGATMPPTASPASNFQFSVEPYASPGTAQRANFTYELQPGHSILDQVAILNSSSSPETFVVYPEDATNIPGTGGFGFEQQGKIHNTTVGKWLTIGETQFTVPVGKQVIDTFQLSVPANAPPGDHVGAIVVQELHSAQQVPAKQGLNLVLRFAVPVFLRVVGPVRPGMTVENVKVYHDSPVIPYVGGAARTAVRFTLVNTGNVILLPKGATISISALIGGTIHSFTVKREAGAQSKRNPLPSELLPGGLLVLTEAWSGTPPFDPLTAHVSVSATEPSSAMQIASASSATFWYFPWLLVVIVIALIVGFVLWRRWRRHGREGEATSSGAAPEGPAAEASSPKTNGTVGSADQSVEEVGV
jgi:hypothetical protein